MPGSRELFELYGKLGYRGIVPGLQQEVSAGDTPATLRPLTSEEYAQKRSSYLPAGAVCQELPAFSYLSTFAGFYEGEACLFCGGGEEIFQFQEFLGNPESLPGVLAALQVKAGRVLRPGQGPDSAMYYPLEDSQEFPAYFALSMN